VIGEKDMRLILVKKLVLQMTINPSHSSNNNRLVVCQR